MHVDRSCSARVLQVSCTSCMQETHVSARLVLHCVACPLHTPHAHTICSQTRRQPEVLAMLQSSPFAVPQSTSFSVLPGVSPSRRRPHVTPRVREGHVFTSQCCNPGLWAALGSASCSGKATARPNAQWQAYGTATRLGPKLRKMRRSNCRNGVGIRDRAVVPNLFPQPTQAS